MASDRDPRCNTTCKIHHEFHIEEDKDGLEVSTSKEKVEKAFAHDDYVDTHTTSLIKCIDLRTTSPRHSTTVYDLDSTLI